MTEMSTITQTEEIKLRCDNATLRGTVDGLSAWQRDPVWRRALLEKLMIMEGFSKEQVLDIMYRMPKEGEEQGP